MEDREVDARHLLDACANKFQQETFHGLYQELVKDKKVHDAIALCFFALKLLLVSDLECEELVHNAQRAAHG